MTTTAVERVGAPRRAETPYGRYAAATVGLMAIATTNGIVGRDDLRKAHVAHAASLVPMVVLFAVYTDAHARRWPLPTWRGAFAVGGMWAAIGAGFELGVGHFVDRKPWSELVSQYNLAAGRTGGLVLVASAAMPALVRLRRRRALNGGR